MDIYVGIVIPGSDSITIVNDQGGLQSLSECLVPWRKNVSQPLSQTLFSNIPATAIPAGTPFEVTTVLCDGWMTETVESEVSRPFEGSISVPGDTGSVRYFDGTGQFFYESPFHIDGNEKSYNNRVE